MQQAHVELDTFFKVQPLTYQQLTNRKKSHTIRLRDEMLNQVVFTYSVAKITMFILTLCHGMGPLRK